METIPPKTILVVEDNREDFIAFKRVLTKNGLHYPIVRCEDGDEALDYLKYQGKYAHNNYPMPSLILLDLNLPGTDGRTVLELTKKEAALRHIPIVVFSTSSNPKDINECYRMGVNNYLVKPVDYAQLEEKLRLLLHYWLDVSALPRFT